MVVWLNDKPNYDKIFITIKKRNKKNEAGYSLIFSKALKDLIVTGGYTHIRLGYDTSENGSYKLLAQLNDEFGISLLNEKEAVRTWTDISEYISQYIDNSVPVPFDRDIKMNVKKSFLESEPLFKD